MIFIPLLLPNILLTLLLFYAYYYEPASLTITEVNIDTKLNISEDTPIRILQISDLHIAGDEVVVRKVLKEFNHIQPDMIVLTGDFLNRSNLADPVSIEKAHDMLSQLHAPLGVYAIKGGSVESLETLSILFKETQIQLLDDEYAVIDAAGVPLTLLGISYIGHDRDAKALVDTYARIPSSEFTILLYHKPDLIYYAADLGIDLYFAGHTHGGQIRLPFYGAIFTKSIFGKDFEYGLYQVDSTRLFVTRGVGMQGSLMPRVRFLCKPEIVLFNLY